MTTSAQQKRLAALERRFPEPAAAAVPDADWPAVWARLTQEERDALAEVPARYPNAPDAGGGWPPPEWMSDQDLQTLIRIMERAHAIRRELAGG